MTSPLVQQTKWQPYWKMWWQVVDQEQQVRREIQNQLWWQIDATITFKYNLDGRDIAKTFSAEVIKVGKLDSAHFHLNHDSVSRMHAYIQRGPEGYYVSDLGSIGGTYLNGHRINKGQLRTSDVLRLGEVKLEVQIGSEGLPEETVDTTTTPRTLEDLKRRLHGKKKVGRPEGGDPSLLGAIKDFAKRATARVYYCEQCLLIHGKVVEHQDGRCPDCGQQWRLNRGQARHVVSMKLIHYWKLARKLGIR